MPSSIPHLTDFALTDHVEGPADAPSGGIYQDVLSQVRLAEQLGFSYAWFAEHHSYAHLGHMPAPLLMALAAASKTHSICVGTTVLCLNLHHPVEIAESMAVVDVLTQGRLSVGLGTGTTGPEAALYGVDMSSREARMERFCEALDILELAWSGQPVRYQGHCFQLDGALIVPLPVSDAGTTLKERTWIAATSPDTAALAGGRGYRLMLSRERSRGMLNPVIDAYLAARHQAHLPLDGAHISVGVALYVADSDAAAKRDCAHAVDLMVQRHRRERPAVAALPMPETWEARLQQALFVAGGPETCRERLLDLTRRVPFTTLDIQPRWEGLRPNDVTTSLERFATHILPALRGETTASP